MFLPNDKVEASEKLGTLNTREFISVCSYTITICGAICVLFGGIGLFFVLNSSNDDDRLSASFTAMIFFGTGLSTVLLGGTTYMLCSIDKRLEAKSFLGEPPAVDGIPKSTLEPLAQVLSKGGESKASKLPPTGSTINGGWYIQVASAALFSFGGGTVSTEMHTRSVMNSPDLPAIGCRTTHCFYRLQNGDFILHDGGVVSGYSLPTA